MTPDDFKQWLIEMQDKKRAATDRECGVLLGVSANSVVNMKANGTDHRTALACAALLKGLKPFGVAA